MSTLTLEQGEKLVSFFKKTPKDELQKLLGSGLLSDLSKCPNVAKINRDEFRRVCGLKHFNLPLLELIGIVIIPATKKFVSRENFLVSTSSNARVKISFLCYNFKKWFFGKVEKPIAKATLQYARLIRSLIDEFIRKKIGPVHEETHLSQIWALMERQPNGEEGVLLTSGYANIFYVCDINDVLRAVCVFWDGDGWNVSARPVEGSNQWSVGLRVFFQNLY